MKNKNLLLNYRFLILLLFIINSISSLVLGIQIHKGYLKYNRDDSIQYARRWWHSINTTGGFYNYYSQGGDCANFVSQIFITGGLRDLTKNLDTDIIGTGDIIKGAQQLSSRLVHNPFAWIPLMEGASIVTYISDMEIGDPIYIVGTNSKGDHWYHIVVYNDVTSEGVAGHTPYEFYPYPREDWSTKQKFHIDPNGSVLQSYKRNVLVLGLAVEYYDFISPPGYLVKPSDWIIPTISNAYPNPPYALSSIHIPDVPVITKIELVEVDPQDGSTTDFYYRAILDDTKNGGDGQIERSAADIKPVILNKDSNIQLRIYFNHPININYNNAGENHYVKLVQVEPMLIPGLPGVTFKETVSIDIVNPRLEDNNKKLIYQLPVEEIKKRDANLKWFIKIRAFSESDDTPLNGSGTYAEYKDEPDLNHWFSLAPEIHVENMEIDWLHVNPENKPFPVYNMQPLRSDGAVIFSDSTFKNLYNCGTDRYSKDYEACIQNTKQEIAADNISSDYYLNMEMLKTPPSAIGSINTINDILNKMYPVCIANIKSGSSLKSYVDDNSIKDFVKLYLDITPYEKHTKPDGTNLTGSEIRNIDITDFYYAASWKDTDNAGRAMVILPLYRIFKEKPTKDNGLPKLPDLPDGIYKIRVETTNGAAGEDKAVFDSGTLKFFKDFNSPYETAENKLRYVEDNSSGFDNQHFRRGRPSAENVYDMAHNKLNIAKDHITNDQSVVKNYESGFNPEILTIDAVADLTTPSGVALKSSWKDQDNNVLPKLTRVFLIGSNNLFTTTWNLSYSGTPLPEYKPAEISYVREIDLTKDFDQNNIKQNSFILKNCNDIYEGDYIVKVHVEDSTYRYDNEARDIKINIAKPVIEDIKIDLDNRLITAKISDIGTPIEMLKIEFEQPMAFQYLDNKSLIFQTRIPNGIDKMTLKVTDLAGNEVKQDFNWDISKLPPEEPSEPSPDTPQGTDLPTQTTVITKTEIKGTDNVSGITPGIPPSEQGSGGATNITQVPIKQGGEEETEVNLESYPINRGGFYNLFDLFWENTTNGVTPEEQKRKFGQVILYYWFQAPRFADYDFSGFINKKYPEIKILIDPTNLKIDSAGFNQKEAGEVAGQIRFHYKDSWVTLPVKELQSYEAGKNSYLATFDLPEPLNEKVSDPLVIFKMRGGEYIQEAVYEKEQPDGTKTVFTWKPIYSNYPSLVYIDTPSLDNPISTGLQFDVYDIDYVRTKFYINDEYIGNYGLVDQLNIKAKSCLAMGQSCETYIFGPIEDWWKMYKWGKWAEEFGGWQGTYFAARSGEGANIDRFIYTVYRVDKFLNVFIRMVEDIFSTFFEAYSLPLANTPLPPGALPMIEKKVFVEYYKYQFETEYRNNLTMKYNYPILRDQYKPDYVVYEPPIPLPEGENTAKVVIYDYNDNQAVTKHKFEVVYTPRILSFGFNKNYNIDNGVYAFDAYIQDYGNDVQSPNISLLIDNKEYPWKDVGFQWDKNSYKGYASFCPKNSFAVGVHKAELIITDQHGHTANQSITFGIKKIEFNLDEIITRDIEGNGDGNLNEGERIYLDLGLLNLGDEPAFEVSAELVNRSRYIKGIPEPLSVYGTISSKAKAFNSKAFEFVISDSIFAPQDIDSVTADFTLIVSYKTAADQEVFIKTEFPFSLTIIRLDPTFSQFNLFIDRSVTETANPNFTLKGSWLSSGCFLKDLTAEHQNGNSTQLIVSRDDMLKTYSANVILHVGENKFVVTATTDSGLSRTAEVSVKLLSQVGIELDSIADTKDPNVVVTGNAWTVNSKLEKVEIYLNGGLIGDAVLEGGRFSLPVTLNGGENIVRAVARDDQGKSAMDEIKVNMHGPLTLRWQRAHWRTTESPLAACGSYEVEVDDIASIVTYVNNIPNTYEVVIDRNLKTFCTKADLQPGSNLLRAVGTTTGGITSDAYSRVIYQTGGVLSIEFDSLPPQGVSNFTLTGRFTLNSNNPYTITVYGPGIEDPWMEYIPVINHAARTFSVNVTLSNPPIGCGDGQCCCEQVFNYFEGTIIQDLDAAFNELEVVQTNAVCSNGLTRIDDSLYTVGTGFIEGTFALNVPGAHVSNMIIGITDVDFNYHEFNITDYNEASGTWQIYIDVSPSHITATTSVYFRIWDTFGNSFACFQDAEIYSGGKKIRLDEKNKIENKRNKIRNPERKREPRRTVDGN